MNVGCLAIFAHHHPSPRTAGLEHRRPRRWQLQDGNQSMVANTIAGSGRPGLQSGLARSDERGFLLPA